jgi:hypothetical protein
VFEKIGLLFKNNRRTTNSNGGRYGFIAASMFILYGSKIIGSACGNLTLSGD